MGFFKERHSRGVSYRLYGDRAFAQLTKNKAAEVAEKLKLSGKVIEGQFLREGILLDIGDEVCAKQCHVSPPVFRKMMKKGWLDGCYKVEKVEIKGGKRGPRIAHKRVFDHYRVLARFEAGGLYDQKGEKLSERRTDQVLRAKAFNDEMRKMNKPFRKLYSTKGTLGKDVIYVDPDWEYSPDAAAALNALIVEHKIRESLESDVRIRKDGSFGVVDKERIADAVEKELTALSATDAIMSGGVLVDKNTGEVLEVDFDDDELKVSDDEKDEG